MADESLPFPVYRTREVKFTGGVAGATSFYNNNWRPENAFVHNDPGKGWHVGPPGKPPGPPAMVWYDFKSAGIRAAEVSLQPAETGKAMQGAPSSYQFIGSNDANCNNDATWTVLCEDLNDRAWRDQWEVRYCRVKPETREKFRCLGIRVLNNRRGDGWISIRNIRMWERIESSQKDEL